MSKQYKDILEEIQAINAKHGINISREKAQNMINNVQQVNLRDISKKRNNWINTGAFDDGYQVGDITKSIIGTYEDFGNQFSKGVFSTSEGIADLGLNLISGAVEPFNKNKAEEIRKYTTHNFTEEAFVNSAEGEKNSLLGTYLQGAAQGEGNLAAQIATKEAGIPWQFTAFASSAGNEMNNAFSNNASFGKALMSGIISGAVEVGSEYIGGGANKVLGMTSLGSKALEKLGGKISNKLAAKLLNIGIDAAGEGLEEIVSGIGTAIGQRLTYMDKDNLNKLLNNEKSLDEFITDTIKNVTKGISEYWSTDAKQDFIAGSLTGLSGSGGQLIQNSNRNAFNGLTDNEKSIFDKEYERIIAEQEKDGNKLSKKEKDKIYDQVKNDIQKGYIDTKTIEDTLGFNEGYNKLKTDTENAIGRNVTAEEDADIRAEARERFLKSIENDDYLLRSYEENAKAGQKFNVSEEDMNKMSDAEKKIYQKAMDSGLNNQGRTHDFVKMVAKIAADKGIDFDFSNSEKIANSSFALKNLETRINNMIEEKQNKLGRPLTENEVKDIRLQVASMVNGFENNGTITLNMESSKTLAKVVGHEITHILEGTDMYDALAESVREYAKSKNDARLKDISDFNKMYSDVENANLSKELTADLVGDYIFTDQEFVNRLSTQNRNLFQKIFDEIKYMLRIATAGSKEARQLEKAKKMFEEAYRQNSVKAAEQQNAVSPKYALGYINSMKLNDNQLKRIRKSIELKNQNYTDEEIWKKTGIVLGEDLANSKAYIPDLKFKSKEQVKKILRIGNDVKLSDIMEGELFDTYPDLKNIKIGVYDFEQEAKRMNLSKKEILEYKKTKGAVTENGDVVLNTNLENIEEAENVLSHEVQHLIQKENGIDKDTFDILNKKGAKAYKLDETELEAEVTRVMNAMNGKQIGEINPQSVEQEIRKFYEENDYGKLDIDKVINRLVNKHGIQYSLSADNQGRELSKEQQEYFKDSKARDENGNLLTLYHGTYNDDMFTVFEPEKGLNVDAIYLTPNISVSSEFGNGSSIRNFDKTLVTRINNAKTVDDLINIFKNDLNTKYKIEKVGEDNYWLNKNDGLSSSPLGAKISDNIYSRKTFNGEVKETNIFDKLKSEALETAKETQMYGSNYELYANITNPLVIDAKGKPYHRIDFEDKIYNTETISSIAKERGYDGVIVKNVLETPYENKLTDDYIVFDSNQVKYVKNQNPTDNPDIRYSLSSSLEDKNINVTTDINNDFFKEHESDFDKNNGKSKILYDNYGDRVKQTTNVYKLEKGDNLAKLSTTLEQIVDENYGKLYIDELYVKNKSEGLGTEIINSLKQYAKENNLDLYTMKELGNPKTQKFWNSVTEQDFGLDRTSRQLYSPYQPGYNISKTDSNGNKLSYQQRQYFKDSKVVDENRNLIPVYHGTNNAGFNIFNKNFNYYTDNQDIAQSYTGGTENASFKRLESVNDAKSWLKGVDEDLYIEGNNVYDISGDTILEYDTAEDLMRNLQYDIQKEYGNTNAGGYYEGYVNITNPLIIDVKGDKWSGIDINNIGIDNPKDFLDKYGSSTFKERGAIRTSTNDIVSAVLDAIDEGELNYDGVIFKNIIDEGMYANNSNNSVLANDYVTFNSNQFKNANNTNPTSDPDIRYSLSVSEANTGIDSDGEKLTAGQKKYFANSKVTDSKGNLQVVYHGTQNYDFNEFEGGVFLTDDYMNADGYAFGERVIAAYVNMENPLVIECEGRKWDNLDTPYGTSTREIVSNYDTNKYDGVIFENINDNWIDDDEAGYPGTVYYVDNSNQVKNIDNENPTDNPDIRYSLSSTGEMVDNEGNKVTLEASDVGPRGTLMAIHNLNEEKFNGILDLGGFPYPSIAVTKPSSISHEGYGDGSAIFNKDTIDPELNSKNKVYSRDAYTPRFPSVEYKINSEEKRNIRNLMGEYDYRNVTPGDEYISEGWSILDNLEDSINRSGLDKALNDIKNSDAMKYIYLKNTNPEFKVETKNEQYSNKYDNETLQRFLDNYNGEYDLNDIPSGEMNKIVPQMLEAYKKQIEEKYSGSEYADNKLHNTLVEMALKNLEEKFYEQDNFIKAAYKLQQYGTEKQVLDKQATREKLDSEINKEEYEKWVDNLFSNIIEKKGLRNNKDYYTSSGNPRSFEQLHDEYNLENVVKIMDSLNDTGEEGGFFYGISEIAGNASQRFNTIEDIKANENLLTTLGDEEYSKILEGMQERLSNIQESIMERGQNNSDNYFIARDNMASAIADAARIYGEGKKIDTNKIQKMLKDYGFEATIEESEQILNMFEEMRNLPTQYFEAKPKRAVTFDELGMMVIPNSWSQQTKQRMLDNNIKYIEYDPSIEGDRQRVINQFDDLKFSLSNGQEQTELAKGSYNVPMKDYLVQKEPIQQVNDSINQLADKITQLQEQLNELGRPTQLSDEKAITEQYEETPMSEEAPIRENMTQSQSEELDFLEDYFKDYMKNNDIKNESELATEMSTNFATDADKQLYSMYKELKDIENGVFEEQVADDEIVSRGLSDRELGKRKVKAYQYEHPEVKPYFQEQAKALLSELNESTFGERSFDSETYYNTDGELGWNGTKRDTSESLAKFKDSNNYTWEEIRQGLEDIINDNGAENNAVSKKLELVIDDRLRNGYKNFGLDAMYMGDRTPANREYINLLNNIQMEEAFSNIPMSEIDTSEDITEGNDLSQAVHGTANEIKRLELALAMKNAKGLDETIQKNVDKLEAKITKPDNLMDMFYPESRKPINQAPERPTITKTPVRKLIDNLKGMFVNENVEIDNLAKEYKRPDIKWAGDMLNNAFAEGQNDITVAQTDNYGREIGKGVNKLFQPAIDAGLYEPFNDFLLHYSNIDRHNNGKGSQTPLNVSENIVKAYLKSYPEFLPWAEEIWNYGKNCRDNMLEAGLIDKNYHKLLGDLYPHYVPYVTDAENFDQYMKNTGEIKPRGLKKAYGQAGKLLPVQEALTKYTFSMKKGIRQNALYNKIVDTLRGGQEAQLATDDRTDYTNLDNGIYHDKNGAYLTAYENGIARNVRISEDLYNGLKNDLKNQVKNLEEKLSLITNPLQKLSNIRRNVLTSWSPTFPIKNAIKDFQGALFNSKHTAKMLKNYPGAIKELSTMSSPQVKQFVALYGSGNLMGQFDEGSYKSLGKNKFLRGISKANDVIELAPRYAEFKASIESGATLEEAMYNAREVTTNFSRGGTITKALNRNGFTFLNSSVQGFDKFVRNFSGENGAKGVVSALLKATMFGVAPALFNDLVFGSGDDKDEDYEALPNYIKDNYYLIKTGDNKFIRIPKGREFSVFGSAARRALEAAEGKENAFEGYFKNAWEQIGVGDLEQNNIIAPLLQAYGSKNGTAWYGGDLVPSRLQDKPKEEQYDASTDRLSVWLGQQLGISPYKLNYVIDQYTGGVGDLLLPLITPEAKSEGGLLAPITDQFTSNSTMKNKYASDFYTKLDELKVKKNSSNATDEDALKYQYMSHISGEMSKLYAEKREVQDSDLSKEDKYTRVQSIQEQINDLAKTGLEGYKNVTSTSNYADVNQDMGYYKNAKGNWSAISQSDMKEIESIGLTDEEKSSYFQTKNSIYDITENYKEKSKDATDEQKTILNAEKKRDIINQIQNSTLPDNGKAALYDKYYGSTDKVNAVIDSEVKFDSYLDLQKQNFTADKDKNGKAINGTKKAKVFNYINSMNIPYIDKCILAKLEYKTFRDADRDIIEYLDKNPNITYDEMVDTLKAMGFEVNGNQVK